MPWRPTELSRQTNGWGDLGTSNLEPRTSNRRRAPVIMDAHAYIGQTADHLRCGPSCGAASGSDAHAHTCRPSDQARADEFETGRRYRKWGRRALCHHTGCSLDLKSIYGRHSKG